MSSINIVLNRLDSFETNINGYKITVGKVAGEYKGTISKTNVNGITTDFYKTLSNTNLNVVSKFLNKELIGQSV